MDYDEKRGHVELTTTDEQSVKFKSIPKEDVPTIRHYFEYGSHNPAPGAVISALESRQASSTVLSAEGPSRAEVKEANHELKAEEKAYRAQLREETVAAEREAYGAVFEQASFGGKTVYLYDKAYVRVSGIVRAGEVEKLVAIEASADVTKKSGLGLGVAFAMTGGLNALSPN